MYDGLIDPSEIFVDGTHIKAAANSHKYRKEMVDQQARFMSEQLAVEIDLDRKKHEKKALKPAKESEAKEKKISTTDPEYGWFHKGETKEVFAYSAQVACDKHGWALAYTVEAGNVHDSQAFPTLFAKLAPFHPNYIITDSGYKNPSITKCLLNQHITPVFPYTRPRGKKGMLRPNDFIYDEHYNVYLCPENQVLHYSTTNRSDYRE
ncbi:transposase [Streptococcus pneumoniae]|uniref:transposase n=1 Tax=Streptococcus pneumoniae TaxID=1313 RepID=UPI0005E6794A|nr:transposase [Streptococcus pneumoniae]COC43645.1 transposase [Streptococcus pneumoniae]